MRTRYRFAADGTVDSCEAKEVIVVATGTIKNTTDPKHGSYHIDGYAVHLEYEDGTKLDLPFFYDPNRPTRMWLGRNFYEKPKTENAEICVAP